MRIVILNGWHKGHVIDVRDPHPTIKLPIPESVTTCGCRGDLEQFDHAAGFQEYRVAFVSVDRRVAMYSVKGEGNDFMDSGFAAHYAKEPWRPVIKLTFGCHDPGAWPPTDAK